MRSRKSRMPAPRLRTAERARQKLADWPASHYGYRNAEVRDALAVLDEVIAQLRVAAGITSFDLSLSANAPLAQPPPPPLPPPSDAELVEQFVAAASIADTPVERIGLLRIRGARDRSRGRHAACRMGDADATHRQRRSRSQSSAPSRLTTSCARARWKKPAGWPRRGAPPTSSGCVRRSRRKIVALAGNAPATLLRCWRRSICRRQRSSRRATRARNSTSARPVFRRYRRSTNNAFKVFSDAATRARTGARHEWSSGDVDRPADQAAGRGQSRFPEGEAACRARSPRTRSSAAHGSLRKTLSACASKRSRRTTSTPRSAPRLRRRAP